MLPFLCFLLLTHTISISGSRTPVTTTEIESLLSFKLDLHDPLGVLEDWDSTTPSAPCDWRGVFCSSSDDRVTEIRLPRLELGGRLSDQLGNLQMLRTLSLRSNSFNGSIPASLGKCSFLQAVFFQYNSFSGEVPLEMGNLTRLQILNLSHNNLSGEVSGEWLPLNLRYLDLSSNSFSGSIPESIGDKLSMLQVLNFSYNQFSGAIPASFGGLQELEYLYLDYNMLEGTLPSAIANCSSLVTLSVNGNSLSGVIPSGVGALSKLQILSLTQNNLSGIIPASLFCNISGYPASIRILELGFNLFSRIVGLEDEESCSSVLQVLDVKVNVIRGGFPVWLAKLSGLTKLDVSGNLFSGSLSGAIGNLSRLEELRLSGNGFTGLIPSEIKQCRLLSVLDLENNRFSGKVPEFFGDLKGLKVLYLGGNQFVGETAWSFRNLTGLETLDLRDNSLNGSFPEEVLALRNLTTLDLSGNGFSGEIPASIGNLSRMESLNLSGNAFSGSIPASLGSLLKLSSLDLSKQNLSGELPFEILGLPNLQVIALQENVLSGDVHEGLSSLTGLRYLNLSSNRFSGQIPPSFGFLRSTVVVSLAKNHISGSVPPELGNCSALEVLELRSNNLSGGIPGDLSRLQSLRVLDLESNNLSGEIPEEISQCSSLTALLLNNNNLSGSIPDSLANLSKLTSLDLSTNNLTGEIPSNLTRLSGLAFFNVSGNNLEGEIPAMLGSRFNNASVFADNQGLCGKPLGNKCVDAGARDRRKKLILFIAVAVASALLLALCCCCYIYSLLRWRKKLKQGVSGEKKRSPARASSAGSGGRSSSTDNGVPKLVMFNNKITLAETIESTRQFDEENVLSRTRYGLVFKACYNDGMVLSIRRLPNVPVDENMFRKEAEFLSKVKHRNLTVLRGYYSGPPDLRLLVYDYMPNGNLGTLLQEASHQDGHVLNWPMRHLIALGIARGLAFLHTVMVHGDVKPQNVLFDADFEAHLSDFGLEKLTSPTGTTEPSSSTPVGTIGYVSPEAALTGEVTKESDVYSFGIVLLELLTGKRPVMFAEDEEDIVKWVKKQLQRGQITELLEPGLLELDPESTEWEEFLLGVKVGLLCTARNPLDRPTMTDVVFMLEGCRVGPDLPSSADQTTTQPSPSQQQQY